MMSGPVLGNRYCQKCASYHEAFLPFRDPWPEQKVDYFLPSQTEVDRLSSALCDTISQARDERPLQTFFEENPSMLVQLFRYGGARWLFSRPRLGSEHIPDFAVCGLNSAGPHWHLVELESPTVSVLRSDGQPRAAFTHARQQIDDWRIWLRNNIQYAQHELGFTGLDAEFKGMIIMGRRGDIRPKRGSLCRSLLPVQGIPVDRKGKLMSGVRRS